jgi:hypothetical protein
MKHTAAELFKQWKRAALLKERTRVAIRERRKSGDIVSDLSSDFDVPEEFIRALCAWEMFKDPS